ncbi:protein of unknown function [Acidithiobacillus ferrivorans]|uniref:Uncharacterized protein n=1 Tax=Acidithiobacillus ferrivorans TaxID=160808 RepID=A0ABY1MNM5_9PROT|nr:protein of unknown function [Acidithiobacillus ferrivorans]
MGTGLGEGVIAFPFPHELGGHKGIETGPGMQHVLPSAVEHVGEMIEVVVPGLHFGAIQGVFHV